RRAPSPSVAGSRPLVVQPERIPLPPLIAMKNHPTFHLGSCLSRREMLRRTSLGFGSIALSSLLHQTASANLRGQDSLPSPHFKPRAKRVIFAFMSGDVSHVDSFDPKPELRKRHGQAMPVPVLPTTFNDNGSIMGSP